MKKALIIAMLSATALAACDDNGSGGGASSGGIATLGSLFNKAFAQDRNDEPLQVNGATLPQFPAREPFDI